MIYSNYISPEATQMWPVEEDVLCASTGFGIAIDDTVEEDDFEW